MDKGDWLWVEWEVRKWVICRLKTNELSVGEWMDSKNVKVSEKEDWVNWKGASSWRGKKDEVSGGIESEWIESKRMDGMSDKK